jgi:hypothetical protein
MTMIPHHDSRSARANLQDLQAAHRPIPDHAAAVEQAVKRARDPESFARLLTRAADLLRPVTPTPGGAND